ncbi:hypothetical protein [Isoptericola croceus]|nr:hypothetical protein [Isoptericola croceus]
MVTIGIHAAQDEAHPHHVGTEQGAFLDVAAATLLPRLRDVVA